MHSQRSAELLLGWVSRQRPAEQMHLRGRLQAPTGPASGAPAAPYTDGYTTDEGRVRGCAAHGFAQQTAEDLTAASRTHHIRACNTLTAAKAAPHA